MSLRRRPYQWQTLPWWPDPVLTRGTVAGLPALTWGRAARYPLATRRQLRAAGLAPGGQGPVAVLLFAHRQPNRRRVEHTWLYLTTTCVAKRTPSPAQRAAIGRALAARRTCRRCTRVQDYYLSTISRLCRGCEDSTDFWRTHAHAHGWSWPA
ncbi:MAG: hypothetical protein M3291_13705 [Actinomycetota bacterium]|nr:hypothetical protein [Actinomycetota bacterium]